jgi:bacterioferritin (cytochrome b1)
MLHRSPHNIAAEELKPGIKLCLDELDHATRELLEEILVDEEKTR